MLPSTGYFKAINCPFYECGTCDRPYCHFKHARREDANTGAAAGTTETRTTGQTQETKSDSNVLQRLVTEAVKKVLANHDGTTGDTLSQDVVSQVVEGLAPCVSNASTVVETKAPNTIGKHLDMPVTITKPVPCVYNPTPIAELKKRHIPIATYMPTRESRPTVKRKLSPDRVKPWLNVVSDSSNSHSAEIVYKPTAIVNTNEQGYVPTCKSDSSSINAYEDGNTNDYLNKFKEAYHPKSKKRREEYVPKKVKAPLTGQLDMVAEILASSIAPAQVLSNEDSQESYIETEAKFSDDESIEDSNKKATEAATTSDLRILNERNQDANITNEIGKDIKELQAELDRTKKIPEKREKVEEKKSTESKGTEVKKSTKDDKKEHRKRSRSRSRERKSGRSSSSSHKSSRQKHKHKSDSSSDRKHHSSSQSKEKEKNRDNYKSRESSSRKEKSSTTEKSKDDSRKSDKHRKHDSKSSSSKSSRSDKRSSDKSHQRRHSSSSHKSPRHTSKKSKPDGSNNEMRELSDDSQSELNNIRLSLDIGGIEDDGNGFYELDDDEVLTISDSDHDVQEECLKIFQEYQISEQPKPVSIRESTKRDEETSDEIGKKRVAHPSAATHVGRQVGPSHAAKKLATPQEKMYERWRLMKEAAAASAATKPITEVKAPQAIETFVKSNRPIVNSDTRIESTTSRPPDVQQINGNGRVRIAHVPYARSLAMQKKKVSETAAKQAENKPPDIRTAAQTAKSGARVAHIPQVVPQLIRPEPLTVTTQKFTLNVRQYYINLMHDICIQIYTNGEDAAQRAVKEELACHEKCKALSVYKNSCMLAAHRLRKEVDQNTLEGPTTSGSGMVSHEAVLAGKSKGSWSVIKTKKAITDIKGPVLYSMLQKWIMTEQQLRDNGFPRPHPEGQKGRAKVYVVNTRNQTILSKVPNERFCCRCGQAYMTDKDGLALRQQNCIYHWGRKFTIRGEGRYSCCQQYGAASGCCDAKAHVWDYVDYENLRGYVRTLPKDASIEDQSVYALDCEMCYTTQGLELTRVTVIDEDCNVVYETLVKPQNAIVDCNTRFSGITEEDMESVTTTLWDVQATLLTMFSDKTILVGHSLESDFKALKLLHDTVVDTSIMFPHKNGYPQKRALKNLCSEYLRKIIQNDVGGHDSKEDAVACMELIMWKVREEAKLQ